MKNKTKPEVAAQKLRKFLIQQFLEYNNSCGIEDSSDIIIGGSVALGTYSPWIGTDLDVFIKCQKPSRVVQRLSYMLPEGNRKNGPLDIWCVRDFQGYKADIVALKRDDIKIQTLEHTKYYKDKMSKKFRDMVIFLKEFFYSINCYGAELGGITGICCTRLVELYGPLVLVKLEELYFTEGDIFIEDPVKEGRNLFASVLPNKKEKMMKNIQKFNRTGVITFMNNITSLLDRYERVYRVTLRERLGTDREYQTLSVIVDRSFKQLKQQIQKWKPSKDHEIMIVGNDAYIGISLDTELPMDQMVHKKVPMKYLSEDQLKHMEDIGTDYTVDDETCIIHTEPPISSLYDRFHELIMERLEKEYIDYEVIEE